VLCAGTGVAATSPAPTPPTTCRRERGLVEFTGGLPGRRGSDCQERQRAWRGFVPSRGSLLRGATWRYGAAYFGSARAASRRSSITGEDSCAQPPALAFKKGRAALCCLRFHRGHSPRRSATLKRACRQPGRPSPRKRSRALRSCCATSCTAGRRSCAKPMRLFMAEGGSPTEESPSAATRASWSGSRQRGMVDHSTPAVLSFVREWRTRRDSNPWPLPSEGSALSS
jgi:hypothetical protein